MIFEGESNFDLEPEYGYLKPVKFQVKVVERKFLPTQESMIMPSDYYNDFN